MLYVYRMEHSGTLPADVLDRFFVVGGECNYYLRPVYSPDGARLRLNFIPGEEWKTPELLEWSDSQIQTLLDRGTTALLEVTERLNMPVEIYRWVTQESDILMGS